MLFKIMAGALGGFSWQAGAPALVKPLEPILRPMIVEVERDPISDAVSAFAVARSSDGRLAIGCDPDRYRGIRVAVRSQGWFASQRLVTRVQTMPFRFDRQTPVAGYWKIRDDAAILGPTKQIVTFVNSATAAGRLTIRTQDIENREKDLTFSMLGGGPAIRQMLQICSAQVE